MTAEAGPHTATTGVLALDRALGGLYWGDNVVWDAEAGADVVPFYRAVAATRDRYDTAAVVAFSDESELFEDAYPGFDVVDARPGSELARARPLLEAIRKRCSTGGRQLLLFDSLDAAGSRWGRGTAGRFFALACPMLLGAGAIAYWSLTPGRHAPGLRRDVENVTQCVLVLADGRLRIAKAEGRPPGVEGSVFRYALEAGRPFLEAAPAAARLGTALRALRLARRMSQSELAELAGVSSSAISQAERGRRGLSLETLLDLTGKLGITLDELLRGEVAPGYRLVRRDDPRQTSLDDPVPLLDDPRAGLRAYAVRLSPGGSAEPGFAHKGVELVAVASGLVQVLLETGRPVLRPGEALIADTSGVAGWRNLGEREALVFWVLHDEHPG
jgi:transcriptional regulator with XRE-family HTH domain